MVDWIFGKEVYLTACFGRAFLLFSAKSVNYSMLHYIESGTLSDSIMTRSLDGFTWHVREQDFELRLDLYYIIITF